MDWNSIFELEKQICQVELNVGLTALFESFEMKFNNTWKIYRYWYKI